MLISFQFLSINFIFIVIFYLNDIDLNLRLFNIYNEFQFLSIYCDFFKELLLYWFEFISYLLWIVIECLINVDLISIFVN